MELNAEISPDSRLLEFIPNKTKTNSKKAFPTEEIIFFVLSITFFQA